MQPGAVDAALHAPVVGAQLVRIRRQGATEVDQEAVTVHPVIEEREILDDLLLGLLDAFAHGLILTTPRARWFRPPCPQAGCRVPPAYRGGGRIPPSPSSEARRVGKDGVSTCRYRWS